MSWFSRAHMFTKCAYLSVALIFLNCLREARTVSDICLEASWHQWTSILRMYWCEASCLDVGSVLRERPGLLQQCVGLVLRSGSPVLCPSQDHFCNIGYFYTLSYGKLGKIGFPPEHLIPIAFSFCCFNCFLHLSYLGPLTLDHSFGADLSLMEAHLLGGVGGAALSYFCALCS